MPKFENFLHYEIIGSGPTIYFLHGLGVDLTSMKVIYEPFFKGRTFRRVYLDLPGMGQSEMPADLESSDDVLAILLAFIKQDSSQEKFQLCGHSYGGYLCLAVAQVMSQQVDQLFLTAPVVVANNHNRQTTPIKTILLDNYIDPHPAWENFATMNVNISQQHWLTYQRAILPGVSRFKSAAWHQIQFSPENKYTLSIEAAIQKKSQDYRGTILLGKNDDVVGFQQQLALITPTNQLEVAVLNDTGHNVFIDSPEMTAFYFERFLTL
ncbi:alpha/beta fold hydrolase [Enterococcus sp. LJL120]